jgi:hypothetical protein
MEMGRNGLAYPIMSNKIDISQNRRLEVNIFFLVLTIGVFHDRVLTDSRQS